jgi:hypothetical protein
MWRICATTSAESKNPFLPNRRMKKLSSGGFSSAHAMAFYTSPIADILSAL